MWRTQGRTPLPSGWGPLLMWPILDIDTATLPTPVLRESKNFPCGLARLPL